MLFSLRCVNDGKNSSESRNKEKEKQLEHHEGFDGKGLAGADESADIKHHFEER